MKTLELKNALVEIVKLFGGLKNDDGSDLEIPKKPTDEWLTENLIEAIKSIEDGDEFSEATQEVIDFLKALAAKPAKKAEKEVPVKETKKPVKKVEKTLVEKINEAEELDELQEIAEGNDEFEDFLETKVYKKAEDPDDLRIEMLAVLNPAPAKKEVKETKKAVVPAKKEVETKKAEKTVKEKKEKGPSAMDLVRTLTCKNPKISIDEIMETLNKKGFPNVNKTSAYIRKNEMLAAMKILTSLGKL